MIDDLNLEDDNSAAGPRPALYVAPAATPAELIVLEQMHREGARPEYAGAGCVLFTAEDEATGAEIWDEGQAAKWRKLMRWPRDPTIAEATAWKENAEARLLAAFWDRLQAARLGQA
jgi:hypothetical protein